MIRSAKCIKTERLHLLKIIFEFVCLLFFLLFSRVFSLNHIRTRACIVMNQQKDTMVGTAKKDTWCKNSIYMFSYCSRTAAEAAVVGMVCCSHVCARNFN